MKRNFLIVVSVFFISTGMIGAACGQSRISGHIKYLNSANTFLDGVKVYLVSSVGQQLDSINSDQHGYYRFENLGQGQYYIEPQCNKPWAGGNSVDALMVQKHFVGLSLLTGLPLQAADVNNSNSVNAIDAMQILQRFVGFLTSFTAGNWTFENTPVTVDGINPVSHDFYGLCYGDINGSNLPPACFPHPTQANAGPDIVASSETTVILNGNVPVYGAGYWLVIEGYNYSLTDNSDPTASFTGVAGITYLLTWNIATACYTSVDTVEISLVSLTGMPCPGQPDFVYGGQTYNTVQIGAQCWMKENLNIGTMINGTLNQTDNGIIEKYCFNNLPVNCEQYGGMYQWDEAMQFSLQAGAQGICPSGWHIPTDAEWCTLTTFLDPSVNCSLMAQWTGTDIGGLLKEAGYDHWNYPNGGATNASGFTALGAGYRYNNSTFYGLKADNYTWCSELYTTGNAFNRSLYTYGSTISRLEGYRENGYSVRCLKD
ncbi:MAG: dockerin type I domain-containing protein [Bacteroidetes bacterium]|nr:dockerin type I domain-containing protein [Bacteroidota bacterium]